MENKLQKIKLEMQSLEYPKKSPNEDEQDYRKRKRGFQFAKSKLVNIFCNGLLRDGNAPDKSEIKS